MTNILNTLDSIRQRRTIKALSDTPLPTTACDKAFIHTLIESAYYAPQHYPCYARHQQHLPSPLPWRFYVLDSTTCRQLAHKIPQLTDAVGKVPAMLNSADYLLMATWCPLPRQSNDKQSADTQSNHDDLLYDGNAVNMEHIAAAGAAIQNLLLTATALGHENYWGSGGPLREAFTFDLLGIPDTEILLGSLFIFPSEDNPQAKTTTFVTSKRRDQRGALADSYRFVSI